MKILFPPLDDALYELYSSVTREFIIVSPWIKSDALKNLLEKNDKKNLQYRVLTRGELRDFLSDASSIQAFEKLLAMGADVRLVTNLHAKIYIADGSHSIISSANLTKSGFENNGNVEVGVYIDDTEEVNKLIEKVQEWLLQARKIDRNWLVEMQKRIDANKPMLKTSKQIEDSIKGLGQSLAGNRITVTKPVLLTSIEVITTDAIEFKQEIAQEVPNAKPEIKIDYIERSQPSLLQNASVPNWKSLTELAKILEMDAKTKNSRTNDDLAFNKRYRPTTIKYQNQVLDYISSQSYLEIMKIIANWLINFHEDEFKKIKLPIHTFKLGTPILIDKKKMFENKEGEMYELSDGLFLNCVNTDYGYVENAVYLLKLAKENPNNYYVELAEK